MRMFPLLAQQAWCFAVHWDHHADPIESHLLMLNLMAKQDCLRGLTSNKSDHSQNLHAPFDETPLNRTQQLV